MAYKKNEHMEEMIDHPVYMLIAPDGSIQPVGMGVTLAGCIGIIELMHQYELSKSLKDLLAAGFKILPVKMTVLRDANEDKILKTEKKVAKFLRSKS